MTRKQLSTAIAVVVALGVVGFFILGNPLALLFGSSSATGDTSTANNQNASTGLVVQDESVGTGDTAVAGDTVTVNYIGKLQDGTVFDSSINRGPISFVLGAGRVIPGWEQGLQGMKVGGKRLLIIPPQLAYGSQQVGPIPPNSTLIFEVDLVSVTAPTTTPTTGTN